MKRVIKFRVWNEVNKKYESMGNMGNGPFISLWGDYIPRARGEYYPVIIEQFTGLQDSSGNDIYEGDILMLTELRFERTEIDIGLDESDLPPGASIKVYEIHKDKPIPSPDVPLVKAKVYWSQDMCAFGLKYLDKPEGWLGESCQLIDGMFRYDVVGNVHEKPKI